MTIFVAFLKMRFLDLLTRVCRPGALYLESTIWARLNLLLVRRSQILFIPRCQCLVGKPEDVI